jgi:hypothetical protein
VGQLVDWGSTGRDSLGQPVDSGQLVEIPWVNWSTRVNWSRSLGSTGRDITPGQLVERTILTKSLVGSTGRDPLGQLVERTLLPKSIDS